MLFETLWKLFITNSHRLFRSQDYQNQNFSVCVNESILLRASWRKFLSSNAADVMKIFVLKIDAFSVFAWIYIFTLGMPQVDDGILGFRLGVNIAFHFSQASFCCSVKKNLEDLFRFDGVQKEVNFNAHLQVSFPRFKRKNNLKLKLSQTFPSCTRIISLNLDNAEIFSFYRTANYVPRGIFGFSCLLLKTKEESSVLNLLFCKIFLQEFTIVWCGERKQVHHSLLPNLFSFVRPSLGLPYFDRPEKFLGISLLEPELKDFLRWNFNLFVFVCESKFGSSTVILCRENKKMWKLRHI